MTGWAKFLKVGDEIRGKASGDIYKVIDHDHYKALVTLQDSGLMGLPQATFNLQYGIIENMCTPVSGSNPYIWATIGTGPVAPPPPQPPPMSTNAILQNISWTKALVAGDKLAHRPSGSVWTIEKVYDYSWSVVRDFELRDTMGNTMIVNNTDVEANYYLFSSVKNPNSPVCPAVQPDPQTLGKATEEKKKEKPTGPYDLDLDYDEHPTFLEQMERIRGLKFKANEGGEGE